MSARLIAEERDQFKQLIDRLYAAYDTLDELMLLIPAEDRHAANGPADVQSHIGALCLCLNKGKWVQK